MADKYDEITQLEVAYDALKTQPRDAQMRMLDWLRSRLADDYEKPIRERAEAARSRVSAGTPRNE